LNFFVTDSVGVSAWYGLIATGMEDDTGRDNPLTVSVLYADGTRSTLTAMIEIVLGNFIGQTITVPPDKGYLLDAETERAELARLESLTNLYTTERLWDSDGFSLPIPAPLTSPFGAFRVFNGVLNTRHTGWDIRTTLGNPVMAAAAGEVIFAGTLPIRGDYVMIDHGYGVYGGYAHFSETLVERGDRVERGQVIGMSGASGRVSGAHFHWEMAVNGDWIDSVQFITMWMP
jgi:murein DD-endopeptidase MepM/ murein hydrolase activator NlpD